MKPLRGLDILFCIILTVCANSYQLLSAFPRALIPAVVLFLLANVFVGFTDRNVKGLRLKICYHGGCMLTFFSISTVISVLYQLTAAFFIIPNDFWSWFIGVLVCIAVEAIVFWNGIISVYCTSVQLGIKIRVIGIICGPIPIANIIALSKIVATVLEEVRFESEKNLLNRSRKELKICDTKYPILMVHGVFFRDWKYFNYWGRIPAELEANGAKVFYGMHQSAKPVAESAEELAGRIKEIVAQTGCEKVNIIAHSKGGLDCRYAIAHNDIAPFVASLTTVNTPHKGCLFADHLLAKVPVSIQNKVAATYNKALRKLGDTDPDFLSSAKDLTHEACTEFDRLPNIIQGIYCQSVGSRLNTATGGKFPLNFAYHMVKHFSGFNDGLVATESFPWGEKYTLITVKGKRGVSHGDMIDLNRENIPEFDVREFYVNLVNDLKNRGL